MKETTEVFAEIKKHLDNKAYQNEEQVRFSLVGRLLLVLGWDIWRPEEVRTEFNPTPNEDASRVDVALFANPYATSVFIEIKSVGRLDTELAKAETQLRNYNRNHTAEFSIITDGKQWRFYYSQTSGEFSDKCFKAINLLEDSSEMVAEVFNTFLSKENISNGQAKKEAEIYLNSNMKERAMQDVLEKAHKMVTKSPFPSLPQALVSCVIEAGFSINESEAAAFLDKEKTGSSFKQQDPAPKPTAKKVTMPHKSVDGLTLYLDLVRGPTRAEGKLSDSGMLVIAGSTANLNASLSLKGSAKKLRDQLIKTGVLIGVNKVLQFTKDYRFKSINEAATVIAGHSISAPQHWKDANGKSYKELSESL